MSANHIRCLLSQNSLHPTTNIYKDICIFIIILCNIYTLMLRHMEPMYINSPVTRMHSYAERVTLTPDAERIGRVYVLTKKQCRSICIWRFFPLLLRCTHAVRPILID